VSVVEYASNRPPFSRACGSAQRRQRGRVTLAHTKIGSRGGSSATPLGRGSGPRQRDQADAAGAGSGSGPRRGWYEEGPLGVAGVVIRGVPPARSKARGGGQPERGSRSGVKAQPERQRQGPATARATAAAAGNMQGQSGRRGKHHAEGRHASRAGAQASKPSEATPLRGPERGVHPGHSFRECGGGWPAAQQRSPPHPR